VPLHTTILFATRTIQSRFLSSSEVLGIEPEFGKVPIIDEKRQFNDVPPASKHATSPHDPRPSSSSYSFGTDTKPDGHAHKARQARTYSQKLRSENPFS
jgi:hypothetical protein